jgi:valyl-tRNA synthetase
VATECRPTKDKTVPTEEITYPTDLWLIGRLNETIEKATKASDAFEFGEAKQAAEDFFWADLCDNYLELSKGRLYGEPLAVDAHSDYTPEELRRSAQATLHIALSSVLRLFAPVLPHITEECWSWHFARFSDKRSIHEEAWPIAVESGLVAAATSRRIDEADGGESPPPLENHAATLLLHTVAAARKWKSEHSVSVKKPLARLSIYRTEHAPKAADGSHLLEGSHLHAVLGDLMSTCNAGEAFMVAGDPPAGAVTTERSPVAVVCELAAEES